MRPRSATAPTGRTAEADAGSTGGPQVWDDMTVEVALSVMASARTGHLLVCDPYGPGTQLVTWARLAAVRDSPDYTDRLQLRDILGDHRPPTAPVSTMPRAEHAARGGSPWALPAADAHGSTPRILALAG
ncbi:hypothetical protein E6R60_27540 [Streptomyces sp. A0642]|uniref:hypothetical protein n=1 Tax=unclassified Streptomyces TaxID=2593676 RepID=UPI0010A22A86|nr:hypothetical protein [Streptomyces sp. A0642]THA72100.1 hypothetical protein E6R60_27540 [Streptomyces sp. A0642]